MNRQPAFTGGAPMLRGALHCHTTRSDGEKTPAELLHSYANYGYDFVAITDHNRYNFRNDAPETGLLVIPGVEVDGHIAGNLPVHVLHTVALGRAYEKGVTYEQDDTLPRIEVKDQYAFIPFVEELQKRRNLTMYCHPQWSSTPAREFENIPGNFALEIWNTGCALENDMDTNAAYWDELLAQGKRIFGVAVDDCHTAAHDNGGWVVARAEKNLDAVLDALQAGAFYSSCGPMIEDFYVDRGHVHVTCSPCESICFVYDRTPSFQAKGAGIREAGARLPGGIGYVRAVCKDRDGKRAWTNPIFLRDCVE